MNRNKNQKVWERPLETFIVIHEIPISAEPIIVLEMQEIDAGRSNAAKTSGQQFEAGYNAKDNPRNHGCLCAKCQNPDSTRDALVWLSLLIDD